MRAAPARRLLATALCVALGVALSPSRLVAAGGEADEAGRHPIPAGDYVLDKSHSTLVFRVSHLGFSWYTASFDDFDVALAYDPARPQEADLRVEVEVRSLQLPSPPAGFRDTLLGPAWFDADAHPRMSFRSTSIEPGADGALSVTGELALKGETRPVTLEVSFNGGYAGIADLDPQARAGFSARGTIRRSDFGMALGVPPEGSTFGVGDAVELVIETELTGPPLEAGADPR